MASADQCPPEDLAAAMAALRADDQAGLSAVEALARRFPGDARLLFLQGSVLAELRRYDEARAAMTAAVDVAPDFAIARFQLGLLELTSGLPVEAEATWGPLKRLPQDAPLRVFAEGLAHLIRDEFPQTVTLLRRGIALNGEIPILNRDMQLIIDALTSDNLPPVPDEPVSSTHLLLQQFVKPTKH
jgi:hypothetical protein